MTNTLVPSIKRWCIVGAFSKTLKGGTSTFCNLIFEEGDFAEFEFYKIDSTLDIIPKDLPFIRIRKSYIKFKQFFHALLYFKPGGIMLFAGHGWGLFEKFVLLLIAKIAQKNIIFFPRSGLILKSRFDKIIFYYSIRLADKVICQTIFWESYIRGLNPKFYAKSTIIYNGIKPNPLDLTLRKPKKKFNILYMGWLEPNKGLIDLIDVLEDLNSESPDTYALTILGKGSLETKIMEIIQASPSINLINKGWISGDEKSIFLEESNCLVLPSYYEGFPNVVLEAMNAGLPVICTDITSLPELLDHGKCGLLFSSGNKTELKDCIIRVQKYPQEAHERALCAKESIRTKFDIEFSKKRLKEVLLSFEPS